MKKKPRNNLRGKKRVERSESRYVLGFCVDLEWANKIEFLELTSILKEQGMEFLFEFAFNNALVSLAMDEFCANFVNTNGTCTTEVRGKKIRFNQRNCFLSEFSSR